MSLGKTRIWPVAILFGMLLVYIPMAASTAYLRVSQSQLIRQCVTIPFSQAPGTQPPLPSMFPAIIAVEDITGTAVNPVEREKQIRSTLERRVSWDGVDDVQTLEPVFENGHLSRIRLHRDGQHSRLQYMIVLPSDEADKGRMLVLKVIESSSTCSASRVNFYDHGKPSKVFYLIYTCESMKKT